MDRAILVHRIQAVGLVGFFGCLDDKCRGLIIKFIDMGLEPAVLRFAEVEREGIEQLVRAEPDVAVRTDDEIWLEHIAIPVADFRVEAVGRDNEISVSVVKVTVHVSLEGQFDPKRLAAFLQNIQEPLASDSDEAMTGRTLAHALEQHFNIIPMIEGVLDFGGTFWIPEFHGLHGGV